MASTRFRTVFRTRRGRRRGAPWRSCLRAAGLLLVLVGAGRPACATGEEPDPTALARLDATLNDWQTMQADFEQTVVGDDGAVLEQSSGRVAIARPGRFRWEYRMPFEQLIVSDGGELYIYDPDLAQVTVGSIDATENDPAAQLLKTQVDVAALFDVAWLPPGEDLTWARLTPREPGATYQAVEVGVRGRELAALKLHDNFGQTTVIRFTDVTRDAGIDPETFTFEPPADADVVRMAQ